MPDILSNYAKEVEAALRNIFPENPPDLPETLRSAMCYSLEAGGKRIRPALLLASHALIAPPDSAATQFACAVEMLHTYSLIHDDLPAMDDDDTRRGRPSNHIVYGEGQAILAGDGLLTDACARMLEASLSLPPEKREGALRAMALVLEAVGVRGMIAGQCLDLENEGKQISEPLLERIQTKKTAALFAGACSAGICLAGANAEQQAAMYAYGQALGRAFQIADDILDMTADAQKLGKPTGSDAEKQKATYPAIFGMNAARQALYDFSQDAIKALDCFDSSANALRDLVLALREREY